MLMVDGGLSLEKHEIELYSWKIMEHGCHILEFFIFLFLSPKSHGYLGLLTCQSMDNSCLNISQFFKSLFISTLTFLLPQ